MTKFVGTLYKKSFGPSTRTVQIVVDLLGLNVNEKEVDPFVREQHSPVYTKKNPMKTVPIYEEGDFCLADSHAIIIYLFDKYGKPEHSYLYPADKRKRATINHRLFFNCGVLFPKLKIIMALTYFGTLAELSESMKKNNEDVYGMLEMYLGDTKYLADDVITLADISAFTTMSSLHGLYPINETKYPKLFNWYTDMCKQDFCMRVNQLGAEIHISGIKSIMESNKAKQSS